MCVGMDERIANKASEEGTKARTGVVDVRRETQNPGTVVRSPGADPAPRPWPPLLTAAEVAELLRTSRKAVYVMVERGQLPGVTRIGRRLLVCRDELRAFLDERRKASAGAGRR